METIASTLIGKLIAMGGGYLLAAVILYLFFDQRKENNQLAEQLLKMTKQQTEAITTSTEVLRRVEDLFRDILRKNMQ